MKDQADVVTYIAKEELQTGVSVAYASAYTETEEGNTTPYEPVEDISTYLTFDDVHYWLDEEEQNYENMICLRIKKAGAYKLTYGDSNLYINASMPTFGFYTSNEASDETKVNFNRKNSEAVAEEMWLSLSLKKICQGLVICEPDFNNNYAMPKNPKYSKSIDQAVLGSKRTFYIGTLDEQGNFTPITEGLTSSSEALEITKHVNPESDGLYDISFVATSSNWISCGEDTSRINVEVINRRIILYKDEACTDELDRDEWGAYFWRDEDLTEVYIKIDTTDVESEIEDAIYVDDDSNFSNDNIKIEKTETPYLYKITRTGAPECS